jgi:hypothetical protein
LSQGHHHTHHGQMGRRFPFGLIDQPSGFFVGSL